MTRAETLEQLLTRIELVAAALEGTAPRYVLVGGALAALLPLPDRFVVRPTKDVDVVVDGVPVGDFHLLEERLRRARFRNVVAPDAPRCRWAPPLPPGEPPFTVDIVPPVEGFEGVSNRWYADGVAQAVERMLPSGRTIWTLTPLYFVASKLQAHLSRGVDVPLAENHDVEDVVAVLLGSVSLREAIARGRDSVHVFIRATLLDLEPALQEGVDTLLPYDAASQALGPVLLGWIAELRESG